MATFPFPIKNRWTGAVQFTAQPDVKFKAASLGVKLGLAVKAAYKTRADLTGADLTDAVLRGVPVVPNIDAAILAAIEAGGKLNMETWHTCNTTHCRAGWAITLAGAGGAALEFAMGPAAAGALIYAASRPGPIPNFYASDKAAMDDLRAGAACRRHRRSRGRPPRLPQGDFQ